MRRFWVTTVASNIALALALQAAPAFAQSAAAPAASDVADAAGGIGEIVVTAEKRQSTQQKTAISMSVFSADSLARNGVGNVADLTSVAPSVAFAQSGPAAIVSVRGVSSRDTSEIGDPAVSISIDGFNLQRALGLNESMFDLERVEVLRGPQGTLVGRNATGGAINIVTAKPKMDAVSAYLGVEAGNYSMFNSKGMINVPLSDWAAVRAAFETHDHDGYRNNAPGKTNGDDERSRAARVELLLKPVNQLSVLLTAEYTQGNGVGPATQGVPFTYYSAANVPPGLLVGDINVTDTPNRGNARDFPNASGSYIHTKSWNYRWQADYDLGFATLTYVGGYRRFKIERRTLLGGAYGTNRQNFTFGQRENLPSWNHEVRLSSNGNGPLKWQFGGFYFQEKNNLNTQFQDYPGQSSISGTPFVIQNYVYPDILARAKAVFGQASYRFLPGVTAEFGARYSNDEKHRIGYNTVTNLNTYLATQCYVNNSCTLVTTPQNSSINSSKTTFHAALNWQATPRNLIYVKYDTGYKAGGFTDLAPYGPETIAAYEIGAKNRFLDDRLQVNIDAYLYYYSNQQVSQTVTNPYTGSVATLVQNAGRSHYKGVELDALFQPDPTTRLDFYVGWQHARFVDFQAGVGGQFARMAFAAGRGYMVSGSRLVPATSAATTVDWQLAGYIPQQAPAWTINAGLEHDFSFAGGSLTPRIQAHFESESFFSFYNLATDRQAPYTRTDIIVTYVPHNKRWKLSAFARNLEDSIVLTAAYSPSATYAAYREQYKPPRTFGASFTYNW